MTNESNYFIRNKKQIVKNLQTLIKQKALCNLTFGENSSFITTLLDIDASKNILLLDTAPTAYLNKQLPNTSQINFRADLSGIKIAFTGINIKKVKFKGQDAFSTTIPDSLFWRQRRQFYRVKSPLSKNNLIRLLNENETYHDFKIYDMSLSGFSFLAEADTPMNLLSVDKEFRSALLVLEDSSGEEITFRIRNVVALNMNKPDKTKRIGCQFTSIPIALESKIQRTMQQIERENKQKN